MTHQYTKLADWHQAMADEPKRNQAKREKHAETARILRAAAGVDVAGLMDVADRYALAQADPAHWRSALESDLRLALAAREGFVMVPVEPTLWMQQAALEAVRAEKLNPHQPPSLPETYELHASAVVYRAMIAAAPKGTP